MTVADMQRPPRRPRIALYQPDIAGNTGTILRLAACLDVGVDVIRPAGFDLSDRALRRAGMDYVEMAALKRHDDFAAFQAWRTAEKRRLVLFSTRATRPYTELAFAPDDVLLFGRESAGVPETVHEAADERVLIPMPGGGRSLNVALAESRDDPVDVGVGADELERGIATAHHDGVDDAEQLRERLDEVHEGDGLDLERHREAQARPVAVHPGEELLEPARLDVVRLVVPVEPQLRVRSPMQDGREGVRDRVAEHSRLAGHGRISRWRRTTPGAARRS